MRDVGEGVAPDGTIRTGVDRQAVPAAFEPVLADVRDALAAWPDVAGYVYGSVATGRARRSSDLDVLTIGLPAERAAGIGADLTERYAGLCRGVELAPAQAEDLVGDDDPAYGLRVFLRHYCVHLAGPDPARDLPAYPADARAARGFNGDLDRHLATWREAEPDSDPAVLGRRVARKTLLAAAGLVSVLDCIWTTDRELAARRLAIHRPDLAAGLGTLADWAADRSVADPVEVRALLAAGGAVDQVVDRFRAVVGLWPPAA